MIKRESFKETYQIVESFIRAHPKACLASILQIFVFGIWAFSHQADHQASEFSMPEKASLEGGRILGPASEIYERKEKLLSARLKSMEKNQKGLEETIKGLEEKLTQKNEPKLESQTNDALAPKDFEAKNVEAQEVSFNVPSLPRNPKAISPMSQDGAPYSALRQAPRSRRKRSKGPSIISFPVSSKALEKERSVSLPSGSFVRARLLTGVEAPEGKALPVLMQADFAFVGPNKTRVDLAGCFMIAKSTGNLSIERVEMQATKISCVSKSGEMFERALNGFTADNKDNSFGIVGRVNTKQGRVAAMAFLSSIVEGIGKSIQQAQTTVENTAVGGTKSIISGSTGKYLAAGGASNAASMVTQWYLNQAQNLLPTINVGSGQEVWIVLQDQVLLPNWYFKKSLNNRSIDNAFSYLSRIAE